MEDSNSIIKSINSDFADYLRKTICKWPELENWETFDKALKDTKSPTIIISSSKGYISSFYSKALAVAEEITSFWNDKYKQYSLAVQLLAGSKIRVERHEDVISCSTYFHTVVLPMQLVSSVEGGSDFLVPDLIALELFRLRQLVVLLEAETETPIVAFAFASSKIQSEDLGDNFPQRKGFVSTIVTDNSPSSLSWHDTKYVLNKELSIDLPDKISSQNIPSLANEICNAADNSKKSFLEYFTSIDLTDPGFVKSELLAHLRGETQHISEKAVFELITRLNGIFYEIALAEAECQECRSDPLIQNPKAYKIHLSLSSDHAANSFNLLSEQAIAQTLHCPPLAWISDLNPAELVRLRENGGLKFFRNLFYNEIGELKSASIDDFKSVAKKVNSRLAEAITDHEQYIKKSKEDWGKQKYKIALSTGFTISLAFVSIITPPLIAIPATIVAAVAGGSTVQQAWGNYKLKKEHYLETKERPVGIIASLHKSRQC